MREVVISPDTRNVRVTNISAGFRKCNRAADRFVPYRDRLCR